MSKYDASIVAIHKGSIPEFLTDLSGFYALDYDWLIETFDKTFWTGPRSWLEQDENFRQPIPYMIIKCGDKFATYTRGVAGGESRLHGKMSIGIGGHVDILDIHTIDVAGPPGEGRYIDVDATLAIAMDRELKEELGIRGSNISVKSSFAGVITENYTPVGRVHIGFVFILEIVNPYDIASMEDAVENLQFLTAEELLEQKDRLEEWSRLFLMEH